MMQESFDTLSTANLYSLARQYARDVDGAIALAKGGAGDPDDPFAGERIAREKLEQVFAALAGRESKPRRRTLRKIFQDAALPPESALALAASQPVAPPAWSALMPANEWSGCNERPNPA